MRELDRILGILLVLQSRRAASARQLAERFAVSTRTIYRDLRTMSLLGIPVYAERGRNGGVRLLEGYFLPPLMFTREEAIALLVGLALLRGLRAVPFQSEADTALHKLLAAVPQPLRVTLARLERLMGVERAQADLFHPEPETPPDAAAPPDESDIVTRFLRALLDQSRIQLRYQSPYRETERSVTARPLGLFWDRDRWYLVGADLESSGVRLTWRADRVRAIALLGRVEEDHADFDIGDLLGHAWLKTAMDSWREHAPVRLRITPRQAALLRRDWYYRFAQYDAEADGRVLMTFGEGDPEPVLALLRWLGPGAELLSPAPWRALLRAELESMLHAQGT